VNFCKKKKQKKTYTTELVCFVNQKALIEEILLKLDT